MPFPKSIREEALVRSQRHCCVCHDFAGRAINVHHIQQESDGGPNTLDNAIVLCLRCHSEAGHFNPRHPIGTSYSPSELIRHRNDWWAACENGTAKYNSSLQVDIKEVHISQELHTYKLLMKFVNGNQHVISEWKLDIFIPSVIEVRREDIDQYEDTDIDGELYQRYHVSGFEKIFLGEEQEILDQKWVALEYDIDDKIYNLARNNKLNIRWAFYSDVEPARKGVVTWEEMQHF